VAALVNGSFLHTYADTTHTQKTTVVRQAGTSLLLLSLVTQLKMLGNRGG